MSRNDMFLFISLTSVYMLIMVPILLVSLDYMFNIRSYELERQDKSEIDGKYDHNEYLDMMKILSEFNMIDKNGNMATLNMFDEQFPPEISQPPESILEIGFGLGNFATILGKKYNKSSILGIDVTEESVKIAQNNLKLMSNKAPNNVKFEIRPQSQLNEPYKSYDVITTTFVNHHIFPNEDFIDFLKQVAFSGKKTFIFNDYHRSLKNIFINDIQLLSLKLIGIDNIIKMTSNMIPNQFHQIKKDLLFKLNELKIVFNSQRSGIDLAIDGGLLSMRRSFSIKEYKDFFKLAGYPDNALKCYEALNKWYEVTETCRIVCSADLSWFTLPGK